MMKKFFLFIFAATICCACNDDDVYSPLPEGYSYATNNSFLANGAMTGENMHFFGKSEVTDADGNVFVDDKAHFEFEGNSEKLSIYMHQTRFAAAMPPIEMLIPNLDYTGEEKTIEFSSLRVVPEANIAQSGYQPYERYMITDLEGSVNNLVCRVSFTCMGVFKVTYTGILIVK